MTKLAELRKAIAAASGAVAELVSVGLLSGAAERWTTGVLAAATAACVYLVPNGKVAAASVQLAPAPVQDAPTK